MEQGETEGMSERRFWVGKGSWQERLPSERRKKVDRRIFFELNFDFVLDYVCLCVGGVRRCLGN